MKEFTTLQDVINYGMDKEIFLARKKVLTRIIEMKEPFTCHTPEGADKFGKAGDFLAIGVKDECYPIGKAFYKDSYEPAYENDSSQNKYDNFMHVFYSFLILIGMMLTPGIFKFFHQPMTIDAIPYFVIAGTVSIISFIQYRLKIK